MLSKKIDFALVLGVKNANPNGDPLNGNRPRVNYENFGEMSDVCLKRKLRNRLMDEGYKVFVQSDEKRADEFGSLSERFKDFNSKSKNESLEEKFKRACEEWFDVRTFGQVFAFKNDDKFTMGVRGPLSLQSAFSVDEVTPTSIQITKSVNSEPGEKKSSDTMGQKHRIDFGVYVTCGSINPQLSSKTGFSDEDAKVIKEMLRTLFRNDASAARPEGSMRVLKLIWWEHDSKLGQYPSAKVFDTLKVTKKQGVEIPNKFEDYDIAVESLDGLKPEIIDGE